MCYYYFNELMPLQPSNDQVSFSWHLFPEIIIRHLVERIFEFQHATMSMYTSFLEHLCGKIRCRNIIGYKISFAIFVSSTNILQSFNIMADPTTFTQKLYCNSIMNPHKHFLNEYRTHKSQLLKFDLATQTLIFHYTMTQPCSPMDPR